jgi:hypothetical protein
MIKNHEDFSKIHFYESVGINLENVFISYSWDNDDHKKWVRELATRLRSDGIDVTLDQWHVIPGDQLPEFMERAVRKSDYVLIICTHKYRERSNNRQGGVGYEGDIMTAEVLSTQNQRKFIPILRQQTWLDSSPTWLSGKYYIDLSSSPYSQEQYDDLLTTLLGTRLIPPPISKKKSSLASVNLRSRDSKTNISSKIIPIQILGIITDQVGEPSYDGTRGSALYRIPFRLSKRPSNEWAELFIQNWNHPSSYSTMHRPGIASVIQNTIVLDGTTIEEVRDYHRYTLILVIKETNEKYEAYIERKKKAIQLEQERSNKHKKDIEDISNQIRFNDE